VYKDATDVGSLYMVIATRWVCGSVLLAACILAMSGRYQVLVLNPGPPYSGISVLMVDTLLGTMKTCAFEGMGAAICVHVETRKPDWQK
jgi:hypothetical protein